MTMAGAADAISIVLDQAFHGKTQEAQAILLRYGTEAHEQEPERVCLALIRLSKGDLAELNRLVDLAKQDRRDILMWDEQLQKEADRS
jgi:hypothetical protein